MLKKFNLSTRITFILKCLLISYLLTTGLLLLLALLLYRFGLSEKVVSICIIGIYIIVAAGCWGGCLAEKAGQQTLSRSAKQRLHLSGACPPRLNRLSVLSLYIIFNCIIVFEFPRKRFLCIFKINTVS